MIEKNKNIKSNYVPLISFQDSEKANKYINKEIKNFFLRKKIENYADNPLNIKDIISDEDFLYVESENQKYEDYKFKIDYFYDTIIGKLEKDENGILNHKINYAITFDKKLVPFKIKIKYKNRLFGEIRLGGKAVFYYIYFDLQEIINHNKNDKER